MTQSPKTVAVIGAGVAGLAFAHRLQELAAEQKKPVDIVLLEASGRAGGAIASTQREGFLLEEGPDAFLSGNPRMQSLCSRLGLTDEIIGTLSGHRRTFIVHRGRLEPLPKGFYLIAPRKLLPFLASPVFSASGKLRMLVECVLPPNVSKEDESVAAFVRRRFGPEALERVGQPMIAGVYSGDPEELSILSTMPRFRQAEAEYGSVIRGLRKQAGGSLKEASGPRYGLFHSFKTGMQTLIDAIQRRLAAGTLVTDFKTASISHDLVSKKWTIVSEKGEMRTADALCLAVPARAAVGWIDSFAPKLSELLDEIAYESIATLNFAFDANAVGHSLDGFGFVAPRSESRSLMACTFVHRKFAGRAPEGKVLLRAFAGGAFGRRLFFNSTAAELTQIVRQELESLLGIRKKPLFSVLTRYPYALPQYRVGHQDLLRRIDEAASAFPSLVLTGSSYRGTGIPDCISDAETRAEQIWKTLTLQAAGN